jgi:hypothetical protein
MNQRRRRSPEEWRAILEEQRRLGQTDKECGVSRGVDPSSLKRWRGRLGLGGSASLGGFVELPVLAATVGELRVILPNGVELVVGQGWAADQVAAMALRLAVL